MEQCHPLERFPGLLCYRNARATEVGHGSHLWQVRVQADPIKQQGPTCHSIVARQDSCFEGLAIDYQHLR